MQGRVTCRVNKQREGGSESNLGGGHGHLHAGGSLIRTGEHKYVDVV